MFQRGLCVVGVSLVLAGCLFPSTEVDGTGSSSGGGSSSGSSGSSNPPPQCTSDPDCGFMDTDQDVCTRAVCRGGQCKQDLVKGTAECQCHIDEDCNYFAKKDCSVAKCNAHKCSEQILPAGPAPKDKVGDCKKITCDGTTAVAVTEPDVLDLPNDNNECTTDTCEATGVAKNTPLTNGTACGAGGICFKSACLVCTPQNATSCGGDGPNEPQNNTSTTPAPLKEFTPFCAFSSSTDVDWYTFYATDGALTNDIMRFETWSTAPTIEICAYVNCVDGGVPGGGCSPTLPGPNGSQGCCWSGAPNTLKPTWDLDCPNSGNDEGTVYVSVRTPGATACEVYAMTGGY